MTSSVIDRKSTKDEIISTAEEYIAITDKRITTLTEERQALVVLLAVAVTAAALF